jgi:predicted nucleic acid-binding protein
MLVLLDTTLLSIATHPKASDSKPILEWLYDLVAEDVDILIPEIADYELRRELIRAKQINSIRRLEQFERDFGYLTLNTDALRIACKFWADLRNAGKPGASDADLDGDVILAAQAFLQQQKLLSRVAIASENLKHFKHLPVEAKKWSDISPV